MPQMAPLNWLTLAVTFTLVFIIFNIINYFTTYYKPELLKKEKTLIKFNWKW